MRPALSLFLAPILVACLPSSPTRSQPVAAAPCASAPHRAFDFWVGAWDVYKTGEDKVVAHSLIERLYEGCAIRENWMPLKGQAGGSLSNFDGPERGWRQTWVDASGTRVEFTGGMEGEAMVLTGLWRNVAGPGEDGLIRMTYTQQPAGAVRQFGEMSRDDGATWTPAFDFTYRPARD